MMTFKYITLHFVDDTFILFLKNIHLHCGNDHFTSVKDLIHTWYYVLLIPKYI